MQKPLKKTKKKQQPPNKHGKTAKNKKGRLAIGPKSLKLKRRQELESELTKAINEENEKRFAGVAANNGGQLAVLRAPPPAMATAHDKKKKGAAKQGNAAASGVPWGASLKG